MSKTASELCPPFSSTPTKPEKMETTPSNNNSSRKNVIIDDSETPFSMQSNKTSSFPTLTRPDLVNYCPASNLAFNEKIKTWLREGQTVYHFGFGQAPFPVVECMTRALREHAGENAYLPVAGIIELREAVCALHERYDNLTGLHPEQILVGPGTKELIFLLLNIYCGDVLVISPTWTTYKPQSQLAHHNAFEITTSMEDNWKITPETVEQTIMQNNLTGNKLLIMCNPDNPTGISYSGQELKALSVVFRKYNVIVLSDEIYGRLHYTQEHVTLAKHYPEGTIISTGFSKWASAGGWRIGYHIYPPELKELKEAVKSAASHTFSCAPAPMQYAVAKGLSNGEECHSYILHTCRIMQHVGEFVHRELTSVGIMACKPSAGYYLFPNFEILREALKKRGIHTCQEMCDAMLEECKVALMAGGPAFLRPVNEFTTRLCYVNFDGKDSLEESMKLGLDQPLPEDFMRSFARPVFDGTMALKNWCLNQLNRV